MNVWKKAWIEAMSKQSVENLILWRHNDVSLNNT